VALLSLTYVFIRDEHTWGAAMTRFYLTCSAITAPLRALIKRPAGAGYDTLARRHHDEPHLVVVGPFLCFTSAGRERR
jgi:hypothetical protein